MSRKQIGLSDNEIAKIRQKRCAERDKRLRKDGMAQYTRLEADPLMPMVERMPIVRNVEFVMIGAGFAGLTVSAKMRDIGIEDICIIDEGADFGGVWYWNRYPGLMCDTAAMIYLPLLAETGYMPTKKYVSGHEIQQHALRIAKHYRLQESAIFSTHVNTMTWDQSQSCWIVETNRGDCIKAKYLALGVGPLSQPKLPKIPGMEQFSGHTFHTSRWDYAYTGGDVTGNPMTNLRDKCVGIIGTGSTAVQCIPPLGRDAKAVFVFQRTPSAINERNNHAIDPIWYQSLEKGWQRKWMLNFAAKNSFAFDKHDFVADGWTEIFQRIYKRAVELHQSVEPMTQADLLAGYYSSDDEKMAELRKRVENIVDDAKTAENLKAWYRQFCKRPCFHDEYLQSFNLPNVHLIDTKGKGVESIDSTGVWVQGKHYDLDCLIYSSGFLNQYSYSERCGFEIIGRGGLKLSQKWAEGMESYQGMHVHGFPNMFVIGMTQAANLVTNITSNYTEAALTLGAIISHAKSISASEIEATLEAEKAWVQAIENAPPMIWVDAECTPGFYNNEGQPISRSIKLFTAGYPAGPFEFFKYIEKWRNESKYEGLVFS